MISLCTDLFRVRLKKVEDKMGIGERNGYAVDNNQEGVSKRNISRKILVEWSKKDRAQLITAGTRLEGRILRGKEGYFFQANPSEEIHKIFFEGVKENKKNNYLEVDVLKVENMDYIYHPEDKRTWGKIRI